MDTKHTPAPWTVCVHDAEITVEAASQTVCAFVSNCDAHLISAAPDLLEALADCIDALEFIENRTSTQYNPPTLDNARSALAKAKGET